MATLLKTIAAALLVLFFLVSAKFRLEHVLAPIESGIHGALSDRHFDILIVGSSHSRQGYDAKLLETVTGKRAFIVAYNGLDPVSMLPVVQAILESPDRRPELLVIEANCMRLSHAPDVNDPRLFFEAPPAMKWELIQDYLRNHHDRGAYLDVFTLVANRGNDLILTWPLVHTAVDSLSYHGSYVHKDMPGLAPAVFAKLSVPFISDQPDPSQVNAMRAIIALARIDHVRLVLADAPTPSPIAAMPAMADMQREFQRLADGGGVAYFQVREEFSTRDSLLFNDSNHLSTAGRELYTRLFAREIMSRDGLLAGSN